LASAVAIPLAYTAEVDAGLRALLGFTGTLPDAHPSPLLEQGRLERLFDKASAALRRLRVRSAHAADADFERLNQWVSHSLRHAKKRR